MAPKADGDKNHLCGRHAEHVEDFYNRHELVVSIQLLLEKNKMKLSKRMLTRQWKDNWTLTSGSCSSRKSWSTKSVQVGRHTWMIICKTDKLEDNSAERTGVHCGQYVPASSAWTMVLLYAAGFSLHTARGWWFCSCTQHHNSSREVDISTIILTEQNSGSDVGGFSSFLSTSSLWQSALNCTSALAIA